MPLPSHHGFSFKLTKFNLYLTLLNENWTHKTKGSGEFNIRLALGSSEWVFTIDEHGNSNNTDRSLLNEKTSKGFLRAIERAGFTIETGQRMGYFSLLLKEKANFSATILPPEEENEKRKESVENPDYQKTFDDFLTELKKVFEYSSVIS